MRQKHRRGRHWSLNVEQLEPRTLLANVLLDPGFEQCLPNSCDPWFKSHASQRTVVTSPVHSGSRAQELIGRLREVNQEDVPVVAGGTYEAAYWIKTSNVTGSGSGVQIRWLTADDSIIRIDQLPKTLGTQNWTRVSQNIVAPDNALSAVYMVTNGDGAGTSWYDDTVLDLIIDPRQNTNFTPKSAIASGNWSDPSTWEGGTLPDASHAVTIDNNLVVTYDLPFDQDDTAEAGTIDLTNGGTLRFTRQQSTRLDLDGSLSVLAGGILDMGTPASPIPANYKAHLGFNVGNDQFFSSNDPNDPFFKAGPNPQMPDYHPEDIGLWAMGTGTSVSVHGAAKPTIWTRLGAQALPGSNQIDLVDTPTGWRVGDSILISPSGVEHDEGEVHRIAAISGKRITLQNALQFNHDGRLFGYDPETDTRRPISNAGQLAGGEVLLRLQAEVALLSHNVTVASNQVQPGDPNHRAHTAAMMGADVTLAFAEFRDLGPRGKLGRYPIHFHRAGTSLASALVDSVSIWSSVDDPTNKWVVIHDTDGVTVRDSVGYNAQGAGYYFETANEQNNVLEGNLGVMVVGPEELPSNLGSAFGYFPESAAVFWGREGNTYRNNVAVGSGPGETAGFWITPNVLGTLPTVFDGNEAHSNAHGVYYSGSNQLTITYNNGYFWRNNVGVYATNDTVGATTQNSFFFGNVVDFLRPLPGNLVNNIHAEDFAADLVGRWTLVDHYRDLNTHLYSFADSHVGNNKNYYEGDFADFNQDGLIDRGLVSRYGVLQNFGDGELIPVAGDSGFLQPNRQNATGFLYRDAPDNTLGALGDDAMQWADIDNDGDFDNVSGGNGEQFFVQENRDGRFVDRMRVSGSNSLDIVSTDVNGDGYVDLVSSYDFSGASDFDVWVNDGAGNFSRQQNNLNLQLGGARPGGTVSGDVDGDGDYDLIIAQNSDRKIYLARNNGGSFSRTALPGVVPLPDNFVIGFNQGMNLGDIDDDGDLDFMMSIANITQATSNDRVNILLYVNDGNGNFTEQSATRFDLTQYTGTRLAAGNAKLVDVDYDNDLDIALFHKVNDIQTGEAQGKFGHTLLNDSSGNFVYDASHSFRILGPTAEIGGELDIADLNGDGTYDLWYGLGGEDTHILINSYQDPTGVPADMPRNVQVESTTAQGITLSFEHPPFAANARYYKIYRTTSPGLSPNERELIKVIGERHQDEGFSAPITRHTTTAYLNDADVTLNGTNKVTFIDRTAQPGITYYYSVAHVGAENSNSKPSPEVSGAMSAPGGNDTTPPDVRIAKPVTDAWARHPEIVIEYADGQSGIDLSSLHVSFNRAVSGSRPAGSDLSDLFVFKDDALYIAPFDEDLSLPLGNATLTAQISDNAGNTQTAQTTINVSIATDSAPTAVITSTPTDRADTFEFSSLSSTDGQGVVTRKMWYFEDGTTAVGPTVTKTFNQGGDQRVDLYVWDDRGGVAQTATTVSVSAGNNQPPNAVNDANSITEDGANPISGTVLGNDSDPNGDALNISRVNGSSGNVGSDVNGNYGSMRINQNGTYQYTLDNANPAVSALNNGQTLLESFNYTVSDGSKSDVATITITINGRTDNRAPSSVDDTRSVTEDGQPNPVSGNVLNNDNDPDNDQLVVDRVNGSAGNVGAALPGKYGSLTLSSNGTYDYALDNTKQAVNGIGVGDTLTETFTYRISDGQASSTSSLTITIEGANDRPTTANRSINTTSSNSYTFEKSDFSFSDADQGDSLQSVRIVSLPQRGDIRLRNNAIAAGDDVSVADLDAGLLTFAPDPSDDDYSTTFDFRVSDGLVQSDAATVTFNVTEMTGDFSGDGRIDVVDVDLLGAGIRANDNAFDLTSDGRTDKSDMDVMIFTILNSTYGDANLDGKFDSTDLVTVFVAGEYEDNIPANSGWREGDWNSDGDFGTGDLLLAFQVGGYNAAASPELLRGFLIAFDEDESKPDAVADVDIAKLTRIDRAALPENLVDDFFQVKEHDRSDLVHDDQSLDDAVLEDRFLQLLK